MANSVQGLRYSSNKYHRLYELGKAYTFSEYYTVNSGEILYFMADTSLIETAFAEAFFPIIIAGGGPFLLDIYNVVDADDDGGVLQGFNRNGDFQAINPPELQLSLNPTINDFGTRFSGIPIPGDRTGAFSTVWIYENSLPFRPADGSKILMKIENDSVHDNLMGFRLDWFEY